MDFKYVSGDERETLYNESLDRASYNCSKRYNMSHNGLSNGCWSKLKAGKSTTKTPLPKVTGKVKKYVHNCVIKYKTDIEKLDDGKLVSDEKLNLLSDETIKFILDKCSNIQVKNHRLISSKYMQ
ncbi:hypothetical protein KQI42_10265 [Tissierella sp. MSJ-40]|uniref:Transposase n=1 Tax=Tissierella simiarum TaxID=2841534 RepID=A0ABS6E6K3_9FIRM|nr:hypothetical protein [Tissierella simiarum]MBU5438394.1 hypothetical protein [Tissierella simiarum]